MVVTKEITTTKNESEGYISWCLRQQKKNDIDCKYFSSFYEMVHFWRVLEYAWKNMEIIDRSPNGNMYALDSIIFNSKQTTLRNRVIDWARSKMWIGIDSVVCILAPSNLFYLLCSQTICIEYKLVWVVCQFFRAKLCHWYCFHLIIFKCLIKILEDIPHTEGKRGRDRRKRIDSPI